MRQPRIDGSGCSLCRQVRWDVACERLFKVAPADGAGWEPWSAALLRLLEPMGDQATLALIVDQPLLHARYVQVLIVHGNRARRGEQQLLRRGDSRLVDDQIDVLRELSSVGASTPELANWTLPLIRGDRQYLVEMFLATPVGIFGLSEHLPIHVGSFGCDPPCRDCSSSDQSRTGP